MGAVIPDNPIETSASPVALCHLATELAAPTISSTNVKIVKVKCDKAGKADGNSTDSKGRLKPLVTE